MKNLKSKRTSMDVNSKLNSYEKGKKKDRNFYKK